MAIRKEGGLERQDMMLTFGEISVSAAGTSTFGATAAATDGVILDTGATTLEGFNVAINVLTAAAGGTQTFKLLAKNGDSFATISATEAIAAASLPAGSTVVLPIPRGHAGTAQYKLQVVSGASTTAGKFSAYVDTHVGV